MHGMWRMPLCAALGIAVGCGDSGQSESTDGTAGETSTGEPAASASSTGNSMSGVLDGSSDGGSDETGTTPALIPARGIRVDWVEANQGVGVPVGLDGEWVGPQD